MDISTVGILGMCIGASFIFMIIAKRLGFSPSMGLIVGGVLLGSSFVEPLLEPVVQIIHELGEVGFIFLMFIAGLEISWSMLYKERNDAAYVATFAFCTPFVLGFISFLFMGFDMLTSLTVGICMSITAEATKANILENLNKLKTKIGSLMMGAGMIDDLIGITLFTIVSYIFTQSIFSQEFIMHIIAIAAYFIGISAHKFMGRSHEKISYIERFSLITIIPFFFISMGVYFSSRSLLQNPILLLVIIVVAIAGKMLGSLLTKPFTKFDFKQLYLVGWGMNSRGAVELAIAFLAFRVGLISLDIYSGLIVMALLTTLLFPVFVTGIIKRNPRIMN